MGVLLRIGLVFWLGACLSACGGLLPPGANPARPLLGTLAANESRRAPSQDGAISPAGHVTADRNAIVEYGAGPSASVQDAALDRELGRLRLTLSFVDTDVREFARVFFSELLHRPYVVDPGIAGLVTVRSGGAVDGNTALSLATQALTTSGNAIQLSDGVYRVTSSQNGGLGGAGRKTFELKHIDAPAAQAALQGLVQGRAEIVGATGNVLSIRGDTETLALVGSMLEVIDVDRFASASFGLFPLSNGSASAVAEEVRNLFAGAGVAAPTILPIERVNALLVIAAQPAHLDFARKWVGRLDQAQRSERQVYVYQVKNRDAADLAKMLQDVFAAGSGPVHVASSDPLSAAEGTPLTAPGAFLGGTETEDTNGLRITADPTTNTLLIWAKAAEYDLVTRALHRLDTSVSQVYVEATIAEVRLNGELSHGVRWFLESGGISAGITDATNGAVGSSFPGFNFAVKVPRAQVVISALESHTDVRIVSTPQLTVVDRETATIQVGDQVPIITKSVQDASSGNTVIANDVTFRDTGVILKVTPKIRSSGEVQLGIEQEVSRVVPTTSSQINSPTISQRKVSSTVLVPDGTAIVLAGLMNSSDEEGSGGLPGTKGSFLESIFGSKTTSAARSELIVIIRPIIIEDRGDLREVANEVASKMGEVLSLPAN